MMRAEVMTFTFPLSLKSEVANDIAHWLYGAHQLAEKPYGLGKSHSPSANEAIFFLGYSSCCKHGY